jgi:malonyl CoA-acyl carrier protein transacylase
VSYLISQGVVEFKEIGPGNVLTRLVQQIQQQIQQDLRPASATSRGQTGS